MSVTRRVDGRSGGSEHVEEIPGGPVRLEELSSGLVSRALDAYLELKALGIHSDELHFS